MDDKAMIGILKELVAAFNAHDLDRIMSFFSRDCILEMPRGPDCWGTRFVGFDAVREGLRGRFAGIPNVHYGADTHLAAGDVGVSRWTVTGTTTAGQPVEVHGCDFYEFREGKVIKKDSYWKIRER